MRDVAGELVDVVEPRLQLFVHRPYRVGEAADLAHAGAFQPHQRGPVARAGGDAARRARECGQRTAAEVAAGQRQQQRERDADRDREQQPRAHVHERLQLLARRPAHDHRAHDRALVHDRQRDEQ
ncbi:MAG: hypothetical protein U0168_31355, partial [Nannocystaceae bacterium]